MSHRNERAASDFCRRSWTCCATARSPRATRCCIASWRQGTWTAGWRSGATGGWTRGRGRWATLLRALGAQGERALLLYPPGLEYVAGFFGCLYAGVVAVPAYPPDPTRLERTLPRLRAIARDAQARRSCSPPASSWRMAELLFAQAPELGELQWLATRRGAGRAPADWKRPELDADTLAFLQYTSGSTGDAQGRDGHPRQPAPQRAR